MTKDEIIKGEIIVQAQKLFKQFGIKKTTMDEIAAACGKAKSTLYHYFKSKEEVFEAVFETEMRNLRAIVKDEVDTQKTLSKKVIAYFVKFHEEVINKMNVYRVLKEEVLDTPYYKSLFRKIFDFELNYTIRLLEDAIDAGEKTEIEREEIPWYAEVMIAAFLGIVRYAVENENGLDHEKLKLTAEKLVPKLF